MDWLFHFWIHMFEQRHIRLTGYMSSCVFNRGSAGTTLARILPAFRSIVRQKCPANVYLYMEPSITATDRADLTIEYRRSRRLPWKVVEKRSRRGEMIALADENGPSYNARPAFRHIF